MLLTTIKIQFNQRSNVVGGWRKQKATLTPEHRTDTTKCFRQTELKQPTALHKMKVGGQ